MTLGEKTLAEILEIPLSIQNTLFRPEVKEKIFEVAKSIIDSNCVSIYIFGSGTSYHAGLVSTYWFSQLANYPTHCELAPEFPYLIEPIIAKKHVAICISQSGESELTVYAAKKAKSKGAHVIAIANNAKSSLIEVAGDYALLMKAGPEESILATKTYVSQLAILIALSIDLALLRGRIDMETYIKLWDEFSLLPDIIEASIPILQKEIHKIAPFFKFARNCFVIGAGPDYANCMEAALKLKEGARIFSQAFSTAETPHGPITLLSDPREAFVLCIIPNPEATMRHDDLLKLIHRLKKKGVTILGIKNPNENVEDLDIAIDIPKCHEVFQPILSIIPVQLLVVEIAAAQNIDCDKPKDLSKISKL